MIKSHYSLLLLTATLSNAGPFGATNTLPETTNSISWLDNDRKITTLTTANINGDSNSDLIALSHSGDEVTWLDLSATNSPSIHLVSDTSYGPESVLTMEATGDAHIDVIISSRWDRTLTLFTNNGSGGFGTGNIIASNIDTAVSLTSADIDGNGHLDIIGVSDHQKELFWISQTSAGNFASKQPLTTLTSTPNKVIVADINNNNKPDLIVLQGGQITIFANDGLAGFETVSQLGSGAITSFQVADVNGGLPDIITSSSILGTSTLYTNDNNGSFTTTSNISDTITGYEISHVLDLDGDNHLDLFYRSHQNSTVTWFKGNSSGSFTPQAELTVNSGPVASAIADFDGDQDPDLAQAGIYGPDLSMHTGLASNPFEFWAYDQGLDPSVDLTTTDSNNDGISNLSDYAFGVSPEGNPVTRLPKALTMPNGDIAFEFLRRTSNRPHGLSYLVQQNSTLSAPATWSPVTLDNTNSTVTPVDTDWEMIRYMLVSPQGSKMFHRVKIEYSQP